MSLPNFCFISSDTVIFPIIHLLLASIFLVAVIRDRGLFRKRGGATISFRSGEESWKSYVLVYGVVSVLVMQLISVSSAYMGHKVVISAIDLCVLIYLFFYSGWFQNRVRGALNKSKDAKKMQ